MNNYPDGAEQDPNAPWNREDDYIEVECSHCEGRGYIDYDMAGDDISDVSLPFPSFCFVSSLSLLFIFGCFPYPKSCWFRLRRSCSEQYS